MNTLNTTNRILIISPVRNEEQYLLKTIESVLSQSIRPNRWIIVDDGSSDKTYSIAKSVAQKNSWVTVCKRKDRGQRSLGGGVVKAFYAGLSEVAGERYEFIGKVDGDVVISPLYFERLLEKFQEKPRLGIASGWIKGEEPKSFAPLGPVKLYRTECFKDIGGLVSFVGWDTIDCYEAMRKGWKTQVFWDEVFRIEHLRKMGSSHKGLIHGNFRSGQACYFANYHPLYFLSKVLKRSTQYPIIVGGSALLHGYIKLWLKRAPRHGDSEFRKFVRRFQLRYLLKTINPFIK